MSTLPVYFERRSVGRIETGIAGPTFVYEPEWLRTPGAFPISMLMPLSTGPIASQVFLPWAANLLPEGSQLRSLGQLIGAAPEDVLAMLSEIGRDTAGALSIGQPGTSNPGSWRPIPGAKDLERILNELPSKPFLAGDEGVSMSLAGVQSKLGVALDSDGHICIPLDGAPSTHILKPCSERLFGSVQNEALCLTLARRSGLDVPKVTTGKAGDRQYFLIERYDRLQQGERWRRLHQEDFCQALGKPPSAKYESNQSGIKGPTLANLFAVTRNAMSAPDVLRLLDHVLFNIIAGNTDAHAKNYSLMISGKGFKLAPLYDVLCAAVWPNVTKNLAQKIAGKNRGDHLKRRHWHQFAADCGLNPTRLTARLEALIARVRAELPKTMDEVAAMPAGPHVLMPEIAKAIEHRALALLSGLEDKTGVPALTSKPKEARTRAPLKTSPKKPASKKAKA